jgi:hypothetical protein
MTSFCLYHGLHLHFTTSYDYQKYNGKVNISKDAFLNCKDKYVGYSSVKEVFFRTTKDVLCIEPIRQPKDMDRLTSIHKKRKTSIKSGKKYRRA